MQKIELMAAVRWKVFIRPVYENTLHFISTKDKYKIRGEMLHTIEISIFQHCQWRHESWEWDWLFNVIFQLYMWRHILNVQADS